MRRCIWSAWAVCICALCSHGAAEREVRRNVLVIHGIEDREGPGDQGWPRDTEAHRLLQTPMEWMGYELRYTNVLNAGLPDAAGLKSYGGLIVDGSLRVSEVHQVRIAGLLHTAQSLKIPILIFGDFPFSSQAVIEDVREVLNMNGDGTELRMPDTTGIRSIDESLMNFEAGVRPFNLAIRRLEAPEKAQVLLSVAARDAEGASANCDPVFLAQWGGMALHPYIESRPAEKRVLLFIDLYTFLARIWPPGWFPAPDPTTRNGMRAFFAHIDGDGFATFSHLKGGVTCGEIIYQRILKKYPFPVTVSVIEANLRNEEKGQLGSRADFERVAREIYRLPQVVAATHTYTHPFVWLESDIPYEDRYETRNLVLREGIAYKELDLRREIIGSQRYIESLLPEEKRVEMVLWSGNCMPGPDAIRIADEAGMENLNGGDTLLSRKHPGLSGVAPRVLYWNDRLQVYAPNQNDYAYTADWTQQSLTGFADVIETYQLTESPRRLKPVNIYYHFYSATLLGPLRALDRVHSWCLEQPLHPMTAARYAKIAKDSHLTRIYSTGTRRWRLENAGDLRTYRIPKAVGVPDMTRSTGVTGFTRNGESTYVHTDGSTVVHLQLADAPPLHLFLDRSTADLSFEILEANRARFKSGGLDLRGAEVWFGGLDAGTRVRVTIDGTHSIVQADENGMFHLRCGRRSNVELERIR